LFGDDFELLVYSALWLSSMPLFVNSMLQQADFFIMFTDADLQERVSLSLFVETVLKQADSCALLVESGLQ